MVKVKAKENFTLGRFAEIKNLVRATKYNKDGAIIANDIFECPEDLAKYLTNETPNPVKRAVVEVIEIIPEKQEKKVEKVEKPKTTRTKKTVAKK